MRRWRNVTRNLNQISKMKYLVLANITVKSLSIVNLHYRDIMEGKDDNLSYEKIFKEWYIFNCCGVDSI